MEPHTMFTYGLLVLGLVGLFLGGDWLVRGASAIALRFAVPPLVVGLTIVGFGTSTPELLVSLRAASDGLAGIAIGNVVGSNIANIALILGIAAVVAPPTARFADLRRDLLWMTGAALVLPLIFWSGFVGPFEGLVLIAGLGIYLWSSFNALSPALPSTAVQPARPALLPAIGFTVAGLIAVMLGASALVDSASTIARELGVSDAMIGLSIVAIGTSLPELATTVSAALKGQRDIALGNVIGSNIFNIFAILGVTAIITPIDVDLRFLTFDTPVLIGLTALIVAVIAIRGQLSRGFGALLIAGYICYIWAGTALA
jgi:cation:H+ antiporter